MNRLILSFFYQFNLNLSFKYYKDISKYNGDYQMTKEQQINAKIKSQQETNLSDGEYKRFNDYSGDIYVWVKNFIQKKRLPKIEESPISIMALLSNNCQNLLSVKLNQTQNINPYALKHLKELVSFRTEDELKQIIGDCFYLDCQVKKGLIDVNDTLKILKVKYY
jgi:hypothetical protein